MAEIANVRLQLEEIVSEMGVPLLAGAISRTISRLFLEALFSSSALDRVELYIAASRPSESIFTLAR